MVLATIGLMVLLAPPPAPEEVTRVGVVVPLAELLAGRGIVADPEESAGRVALRLEDRSIVPLIRDEASRALFLDERLHNRPARLVGRLHEGLPSLQVVEVRVEHEGRFRIPEYWCEVCSIAARAPQICPCCQSMMDLRMKPESGD